MWVDASLRPEAERVVAAALPELRDSLNESDYERWSAIVASLEQSTDSATDARIRAPIRIGHELDHTPHERDHVEVGMQAA